ncbi:hypothetical protein [Myxacorys almedinensis]|uniref:Uncharacterized protein n=1 Tax=Myxacorys almedinensis A TaxID=2690445 RepID=A0A8J7Z073_9CYAN|nr:hypothetical protein [Myxacorys almedinensis]NDJ15713.1 hypothetical protein [Myxacorys almedinensis A]
MLNSSPMSVGNVVSAGFRLYRSRLKAYLGISTRATLWAMLPWALLIPLLVVAFVPFALSQGENPTSLILLLLIFPWVALAIYCGARSSLNSALIARLAYGELSGQPEDSRTAFRQIRPRMWNLLLVHIAVGMVMFGINFGLSIAQQFLIILPAIAFRDAPAIAGIFAVVAYLGTLVVYFWFWAHFYIPEVAIAMEGDTNAFDMVGRSWNISKGSANRILLILSVAALITFPLYGLVAIPVLPALVGTASLIQVGDVSAIGWFLIAIGVGILLLLLVNLFTLPFWQTLKAVVYYDLRTRREGVDLKFRNSITDEPRD